MDTAEKIAAIKLLYLYNQRIDSVFRDWHNVLWQAFSASSDNNSLLNLFRHSSLLWRLRGQVGVE